MSVRPAIREVLAALLLLAGAACSSHRISADDYDATCAADADCDSFVTLQWG